MAIDIQEEDERDAREKNVSQTRCSHGVISSGLSKIGPKLKEKEESCRTEDSDKDKVPILQRLKYIIYFIFYICYI